MFPATQDRVALNTSHTVNERIRRQTDRNVAHYATAGREEIDTRLKELDQEWDIERILEANASVLALAGVGLGATVSRRWLLLPGLVTAFLCQHALQGWCPPVPILRRLGVRTTKEINEERYALKALRGDFEQLANTSSEIGGLEIQTAMIAVRKA